MLPNQASDFSLFFKKKSLDYFFASFNSEAVFCGLRLHVFERERKTQRKIHRQRKGERLRKTLRDNWRGIEALYDLYFICIFKISDTVLPE